jgi:hypothetical protein
LIRKLALLTAVFTLTLAASAQESSANLFTGYSFGRIEAANGQGGVGPGKIQTNGWNVAVSKQLFPALELVADVSGHYGTLSGDALLGPRETQIRSHTLLFGPQIGKSFGRVRPFIRGLVGVNHQNLDDRVLAPAGTSSSRFRETALAYGVGGGLDVRTGHRFSLRLLQVDYLNIDFSHASSFDNLRFATGLIWHFGK